MKWRYQSIVVFFVFVFFVIIARLFYWQIIKAEEFSVLGQSQYGRIIKLQPKRGEIRTSDGFPIVSNKLSYLVFANPKEVKDKKTTAEILSLNLSVSLASVSSQLAMDRFWVPIKSHIDATTKQALDDRKIPGVGFEQTYLRFYPEASMAAQLVGFVGKDDGGDDKGYFGIEGYYDRQLRGKEGIVTEVQDVFGRPILAKANDKSPSVDGRNLTLSIDRAIQYFAEKSLSEGVIKYGASGGMIGILEPKTGEIIAMASYPSFDPLHFIDYPADTYKNPLISNLYEPGSTFKALTMAAGIDSGVVRPDTKCPICSGPVTIGEYQIRTWNNQYEKDISMIDVIRHSDNTGMVFVGRSLGLDRMLSYLAAFGIGKTTGIDLQGEVSGDLKAKDQWYPIDLATASFGQGISVTPLQILSGFSALANGGTRMDPHAVKSIETSEGQIITIAPKVASKPISSVTAKVMTEILVNAVNKGEAQWTRLKGYRIAGKTGTAQIPIDGHYDPNKTIASFIGFAPADNPKFAMLVIVDRPTTSIYGAETAAPIFFDVAKKILDYYQIPPTEREGN